jgi:hypothetical protein
MNNTLQLIFESRGWIQKASIDRLPAELRNGIIACTKKEVLV